MILDLHPKTGYYCLVFETLGTSLYDIVKRNDYQRFPLYVVRDVARQLLDALAFLETIGLIHTGTAFFLRLFIFAIFLHICYCI